MTFDEILEKYRTNSFSERDKGTRFEVLMKNFLPLHYRGEIEKVMLWNEFSNEKDLGIDLVAKTFGGEYWAIQCKFYAEGTSIEKSAVDSFISNSGRTFDDKKFSLRIFISTSDNFTENAAKMFENQTPPVVKIVMEDLRKAEVDWEKLDAGISDETARIVSKDLRDYQQEALDAAHKHFETNERGKLIMACGTGKTFTSLRIAEDLTNNQGLVLFLVPSLTLVKQTLQEWRNLSVKAIRAVCVCSDKTVAKKNNDDYIENVHLTIPVTNQPEEILKAVQKRGNFGMTVIFSTYQSIDKVIAAKLNFDLVICDEAHRTAGNSQKDKKTKLFAMVHSNENIKAARRMYMTATPKYKKDSNKNPEKEEKVWSMDDEKIFGTEIFKISFQRAISLGCLSDFQVLIFAVSEGEVQQAMRDTIASKVQSFVDKINEERKKKSKSAAEIKFSFTVDDMAKLVGTINALSKRVTEDSEYLLEGDFEPMHKALAFLPKIINSEVTAEIFNHFEEIYLPSVNPEESNEIITVEAEHVDGSMSSAERAEALNKLKNVTEKNLCRIVTNVRCLSEGVDVPSLDAVIFLAPKESKIDIVQAVGRALRIAPDKKFGYIIIPIIAPQFINGETKDYYEANNKRYETIYKVVEALKSHDEAINGDIERLHATGTSKRIKIVPSKDFKRYNTELPFEIFKTELIAKVVEMNGTKSYWWHWAKKVSVIVQRHTEKIKELIAVENSAPQIAFQNFINDLQKIINPSITEEEAVDMLAQHLITRPVFEALFENYSFAQNNAVSKSLQKVLEQIDNDALNYERGELKEFYDNVKESCRDMGNAANRQKIIVNLYDSFFKQALPLTAQKLGIVYTPVEVVDFILQSVNDVLQKEFNRTISDENVHILDPFTGTGTFITRLIQSGLIRPEDLLRKYQNELHANEIVLLAYYIAAINIENSFHAVANSDDYQTFNGICLADTFQSYEIQQEENDIKENKQGTLNNEEFATPLKENAEFIKKQLDTKIEIIIGNPPYSVGQKSANDNAQNIHYDKLEKRIAETYAAGTDATNKNSLYDSYIKAFRWASDRIKNGGIIGFVTNAGWLDGAAMDGLRNCFAKEFTSIYVFNLRGNQRTQGEISRKEGGKIFGSGSRAPIAITILVKNPAVNRNAEIFYCDIGDYLSREEKLEKIKKLHSVLTDEFKPLTPNDKGDWINQRGNNFDNFIPIGDKKNHSSQTFFCEIYGNGIETKRDAWCYNFSNSEIAKNIQTTIDFYNTHSPLEVDSTKISWSMKTVNNKNRGIEYKFDDAKIIESMYRPFCKEFLYYDRNLNDVNGQIPKIFPNGNEENLLIDISGVSGSKDFSVMIFNKVPCYDAIEKGQCFPLYWYEKSLEQNLFGESYERHSGITEFILKQAQERYSAEVSAEEIFYYVYGFLHLPAYREKFAAELKKSLPRLILVERYEDFLKLYRAGRELAEIHLNYETQEPPAGVKVIYDEGYNYRVHKMKFNAERTEIIYNDKIKIVDIPARANEYVVNGRSPLEWIVDRYQIKTDSASGIENNPNYWCDEHDNPRYIFDLILSCITVSLKTLDIVENLPTVDFE